MIVDSGNDAWNTKGLAFARPRAFRGEATAFPQTRIECLIAEQAERTPQAPAVSDGHGKSLDYAGLIARADQFAAAISRAAPARSRIGVSLQRNIDLVPALLGVWRAGCAYVPIDPGFPSHRKRFILDTVRAAALIVDQTTDDPGNWEGPTIRVEQLEAARSGPRVKRTDVDDAAYVIFTSGSTGAPKGVEIAQRSVANFLTSSADVMGFSARDVWIANAATTFDPSVLELFLPLMLGGKVVVVRREDGLDGERLMAIIRREGGNVLQYTPTQYRLLLDTGFRPGPELRMLCGGEAMGRDLARALKANGAELWNLYGPTETTVWATVCLMKSGDDAIRIGEPIANTTVLIQDEDGAACPDGSPGELIIGGAGLAISYFDRPDLTEKAFVRRLVDGVEERVYRTGDLAVRHPDGIELLGRIDTQVKIRGHRIELEEIEAVIRQAPGVRSAAVHVDRTDPDDMRLIAYLVGVADATGAKAAVTEKLPTYMRPSAWRIIDALPLTTSGKVDRKALPDLSFIDGDRHDPAPPEAAAGDNADNVAERAEIGEIDPRLIAVWCETLKTDHVSPNADFFDLGGHSLIAHRLSARIAEAFGVHVGAAEFFEWRTLGAIAAALAKAKPGQERRIVPIRQFGDLPPVFVINHCMMYHELAGSLGADRPVIGVRLYDPMRPRPLPKRSLEDLASEYVRLIEETGREGPYTLVGLCSAGVLAYEIAQQLTAQNKPVELLVMSDSWSPDHQRAMPFWRVAVQYLAARANDLKLRLASSRNMAEFLGAYRFIRRLKILEGAKRLGLIRHVPPPIDDYADGWIQRQLDDAVEAYTPKPYSGDVLLLRSDQEVHVEGVLDKDLGWRPHIKGRLRLTAIPGQHLTMFTGKGAMIAADNMRPSATLAPAAPQEVGPLLRELEQLRRALTI